MSIDPTGTKPGLDKKPEEPKPIMMKCRNPKCDGMTVTELKVGGPGHHTYRCTVCGHTWGVPLGGSVNF